MDPVEQTAGRPGFGRKQAGRPKKKQWLMMFQQYKKTKQIPIDFFQSTELVYSIN